MVLEALELRLECFTHEFTLLAEEPNVSIFLTNEAESQVVDGSCDVKAIIVLQDDHL